jgi:hypothetical protein
LLGGIIEHPRAAGPGFLLSIKAALIVAATHTSLREGKFFNKGRITPTTVFYRCVRHIHVAVLRRKILTPITPFIQRAIQATEQRFLVNGLSVASGRIDVATRGKDNRVIGTGSIFKIGTGGIGQTDLGPGAGCQRGCDGFAIGKCTPNDLLGVPVAPNTHRREEIVICSIKWKGLGLFKRFSGIRYNGGESGSRPGGILSRILGYRRHSNWVYSF